MSQSDYIPHPTHRLSQQYTPSNRSSNYNIGSYGDTLVKDKARLHQDDVFNIKYTNEYSGITLQEKNEQDEQYKVLQRSLTFARMDARERNIAPALPSTCQWLFRHRVFKQWATRDTFTDHNGSLWIKGKPGCGKSTIMKATLNWAGQNFPAETSLSYFFNARSTEILEKSTLGMYRYLVWQLCSGQDCLKQRLVEHFESKQILRDGYVEEWTEQELQNFILLIVSMTVRMGQNSDGVCG